MQFAVIARAEKTLIILLDRDGNRISEIANVESFRILAPLHQIKHFMNLKTA